MGYYAIARIIDSIGVKKIRFIDTESKSILDIELNGIALFMSRHENIVNLIFTDEGIESYRNGQQIEFKDLKGIQGVLDRYPMIDNQKQKILNRDTAIVLNTGVIGGNTSNRVYTVVFFNGRTAVVTENQLIQYGEKFGLANCKIINRGNKKYITPIEGRIEELVDTTSISINMNRGTLVVKLPIKPDTTLEIGDTESGILVDNISSIEIVPRYMGNVIKKLILPRRLKRITRGLFRDMPNLEEIVIQAPEADIYDRAFTGCLNLRIIRAVSIHATGERICTGLPRLEAFYTERPMLMIHKYSFSRLPNFDIGTVLREGVAEIREGAFENTVSKSGEITLPSTLSRIYITSFRNNKGLKRVYIKTNALEVIPGYGKLFAQQDRGLEVHISSISNLSNDRFDLDHINLVQNNSLVDKRVEKLSKRAAMLGNTVDVSTIKYMTREQLADAIMTVRQESLTDTLYNDCMYLLTYKISQVCKLESIDLCKMYVNIKLGRGGTTLTKVVKTDKFILLVGRKLFIIPHNKRILSSYVKKIINEFHGYLSIKALEIKKEGLKSLDVAENGSIRAIYQYKGSNAHHTETYDDFRIEEE